MSSKPASRPMATSAQKENFKLKFATIIKDNATLKDQYTIQFFETAQKSNYVFNGRDGKSINIMPMLSLEEAEEYRVLKSTWQGK